MPSPQLFEFSLSSNIAASGSTTEKLSEGQTICPEPKPAVFFLKSFSYVPGSELQVRVII